MMNVSNNNNKAYLSLMLAAELLKSLFIHASAHLRVAESYEDSKFSIFPLSKVPLNAGEKFYKKLISGRIFTTTFQMLWAVTCVVKIAEKYKKRKRRKENNENNENKKKQKKQTKKPKDTTQLTGVQLFGGVLKRSQ